MRAFDIRSHRSGLTGLSRRGLLQGGLSIGGLSLLTGCDLQDDDAVDRLLFAISRWNDSAQAALFDPNRLAPEYPASRIANPFPFNAYYPEERAPEVDGAAFRLELSGRIANQRPWTLPELNALPRVNQITRHICIEGWSAIGAWGGVRFSDFLTRIGADTKARYVAFRCADDYTGSIDMATALHPQTMLALSFGDRVLPRRYGFPMKLRVPTKLGFKNPKHLAAIEVTNEFTSGFWEKYGYNWFSGL